MIEVTAAIIINKDKILIARRKVGKHLAGHWEFPGGKIEKGETPEECLKRELYEEFSINAKIDSYVGESIYDYSDKIIKLIGYTAQIISGEFKLIDHDKIEWVSLDEILKFMMAPADIPLIKLYESKRNNK